MYSDSRLYRSLYLGVPSAGRSSDVFDGSDDEEVAPKVTIKKRSVGQVAGLQINFQNSDDDSDWEVETSKKRKTAETA